MFHAGVGLGNDETGTETRRRRGASSSSEGYVIPALASSTSRHQLVDSHTSSSSSVTAVFYDPTTTTTTTNNNQENTDSSSYDYYNDDDYYYNQQDETKPTDGDYYEEEEEDGDDDAMFNWGGSLEREYDPESIVVDFHRAPRFGHSNRIGLLASSIRDQQLDYAGGIKQFTLFILLPFFFWFLLLLLFKCKGRPTVGCAAGGHVLDILQLARDGVKRKIRRQYLLRQWRTQTCFIATGICIPVVTALLIRNGLNPLVLAWDSLQEIAADVDILVFRGIGIVHRVAQSHHGLQTILQTYQQQQQEMIESWTTNNNNATTGIFNDLNLSEAMEISPWCPNSYFFKDDGPMEGFQQHESLTTTTKTSAVAAKTEQFNAIMLEAYSQVKFIVQYMDNSVLLETSTLHKITETTQHVEQAIDWAKDHDWLLKFLLMVVNVFGLLMVAASYIVVNISPIVHLPSKYYLSYIVVPVWILLCILLVVTTSTMGIATLLNSDFCAGGDGIGSPQGSIEDAILSNRFGSLDRELGENLLIYESFQYYANGCLDDVFPLEYLDEFSPTVDTAVEAIELLATNLNINDTETLELLGEHCGADLSHLPSTLEQFSNSIGLLKSSFSEMLEITACHKVSPIIRRITRGSLCSDSAISFAWIWSCLLVLSVFGFVMLTTRSAMFSTVITRRNTREDRRNNKGKYKPRKLKPECVEKEFREYQEFMAQYFDDVHEWCMIPKKKLVAIEGLGIMPNPTFDTQGTTPTSSEGTEGLQMPPSVFKDEENSHEESGDEESNPQQSRLTGLTDPKTHNQDDEDVSYYSGSEASTDEDDDSTGDDASAFASVMSFSSSVLSDAKSAAKSALNTIRAIPSLLGNRRDSSGDDEEEDDDVIFSTPMQVAESPYSARIGRASTGILGYLSEKFHTPASRRIDSPQSERNRSEVDDTAAASTAMPKSDTPAPLDQWHTPDSRIQLLLAQPNESHYSDGSDDDEEFDVIWDACDANEPDPLDQWHTPPNQIIPPYEESRTQPKGRWWLPTPKAPKKEVQRVSRTEVSEGQPLLSPSTTGLETLDTDMIPRQLKMSPLLSPPKSKKWNLNLLPRQLKMSPMLSPLSKRKNRPKRKTSDIIYDVDDEDSRVQVDQADGTAGRNDEEKWLATTNARPPSAQQPPPMSNGGNNRRQSRSTRGDTSWIKRSHDHEA